jgi:hypothetical protein
MSVHQVSIVDFYMVESCVVACLRNWRYCDIATEIMERAMKQLAVVMVDDFNTQLCSN